MGHIQSIEELITFVQRRWKMMLPIALLGAVLAVLVAGRLPSTYEAAAAIQVEGAAVDQAGGSDEDASAGHSTAQVLQSIEQRLTARENMLAVIERHQLYSDMPALTPDQKIALLRQSLTFQSVARAANPGFGAAPEVSAMIILARSTDPVQAAAIANDFAQGLLDGGNASQALRTRDTLEFYLEESRRIETEMEALDTEVARYRAGHAASLPSARASLQDESSGLETDLRMIERDLAGLNGQKAQVEQTGLTRLTDQRQFETISQQIAIAEAQRGVLLARRDALQKAMADGAMVDRALSGFERRSDQLQAQYTVVSRRMAEAETASRLASRQQSERITLLEPAVAPQKPISGRATKVALAGVVASLAFAVLAAFLHELAHPIVRTAAQMERELGLWPVVSIPEIKRGRRRLPGGGGAERRGRPA